MITPPQRRFRAASVSDDEIPYDPVEDLTDDEIDAWFDAVLGPPEQLEEES